MTRKTSIEFPEGIEPTLAKLEASYALKNVIAGGILALSRLPAEEREMLIAEANGVILEKSAEKSSQIKSQAKTLREVLKNMVESSVDGSEMPSMTIEIRPADKPLWNELRNLIGAELKKRGKKTRRG